MTTQLDPGKLTQLLNQNTQQLDDKVLSALSQARLSALSRQSPRLSVLALTTGRWSISHKAYPWVIAALLAGVLLSGVSYWHRSHEQQINELDIAILTDDLPIEVFID